MYRKQFFVRFAHFLVNVMNVLILSTFLVGIKIAVFEPQWSCLKRWKDVGCKQIKFDQNIVRDSL